MSGAWIFGYGSLVNPISFGQTLGRDLIVGVDVFPATVQGYGRRWNYGVRHLAGIATDGSEYTIVALGLEAAPGEAANGVVSWVSEAELPMLDRRERDYDRVDVTIGSAIDLEHPLTRSEGPADAPIMTYIPRRQAISHYEAARDAGRAAIEQRYWDLVAGAFAALGGGYHDEYLATTPPPDVPVMRLRRSP